MPDVRPIHGIIQILGAAKTGKTTFISQLTNHATKETRYEHTSEIIRYNLRINVHPTAMYGDLLSPAYTVSLYDTPGTTSLEIQKDSIEEYLTANITQPQVNPVPESVAKKFDDFEKKKLKYVSTMVTNYNTYDDQFGNNDDLEEGGALSIAPMMNMTVSFDQDLIMAARKVFEVVPVKGKSASIMPTGGYIVLFDLNAARRNNATASVNESLIKAEKIIIKIRHQTVLAPIVLFANMVELCEMEDANVKNYRNEAQKMCNRNDAIYFEGSSLLNYVKADPKLQAEAVMQRIEANKLKLRDGIQGVDSVITCLMWRLMKQRREIPPNDPPMNDVTWCSWCSYWIFLGWWELITAFIRWIFRTLGTLSKMGKMEDE